MYLDSLVTTQQIPPDAWREGQEEETDVNGRGVRVDELMCLSASLVRVSWELWAAELSGNIPRCHRDFHGL